MLEIKGFIPNTMLDWEGMLASTVFLPRCNFRCPFCQNPDLVLHPERLETVPFSVISDYLRDRSGWVDGVCITGGEPCLHEGLAGLCADFRDQGVNNTHFDWPTASGRLVLLFRISACDELTPPLHRAPPGQHTGHRLAEGAPSRRAFVTGTMRLPAFGTIVSAFDASDSGSLTFVFSSPT